jgi:hypothetical protein
MPETELSQNVSKRSFLRLPNFRQHLRGEGGACAPPPFRSPCGMWVWCGAVHRPPASQLASASACMITLMLGRRANDGQYHEPSAPAQSNPRDNSPTLPSASPSHRVSMSQPVSFIPTAHGTHQTPQRSLGVPSAQTWCCWWARAGLAATPSLHHATTPPPPGGTPHALERCWCCPWGFYSRRSAPPRPPLTARWHHWTAVPGTGGVSSNRPAPNGSKHKRAVVAVVARVGFGLIFEPPVG